jgi:hypothetical protein
LFFIIVIILFVFTTKKVKKNLSSLMFYGTYLLRQAIHAEENQQQEIMDKYHSVRAEMYKDGELEKQGFTPDIIDGIKAGLFTPLEVTSHFYRFPGLGGFSGSQLATIHRITELQRSESSVTLILEWNNSSCKTLQGTLTAFQDIGVETQLDRLYLLVMLCKKFRKSPSPIVSDDC